MGVCKTRTGYLRMADADGKIRIEKCGWKNADNKKSKRKNEKSGWQKKNKQTIKERNLSFKSLSHGWTLHLHTERDANSWHSFYPVVPFINVTEIRTLRSSSLNAHILGALLL